MKARMNPIYAALAAAAYLSNLVRADDCSQGSTEIEGNWYCQAVTTVQYSGLGVSGTYNRVTDMDSSSGACSSTSQAYSGNLSPLDEEVSLHFRGPINIKQFAVYTPANSATAAKHKKREEKRSLEARAKAHLHEHKHAHAGHNHARSHKHNKAVHAHPDKAVVDKRGLPDVWVTATIDGQVVSWINTWDVDATASASTAAATTVANNVNIAVKASSVAASFASAVVQSAAAGATTLLTSTVGSPVSASSSLGASLTSSAISTSTSSSDSSVDDLSSSGEWSRIGYYDSSSQTRTGLTFLNHFGGSGSGTFDYKFGNSLSYASANGQTGASSSTTLEDTLLPSNTEVIIMTDTSCEEDDGCYYTRNGSVAYHGFDGAEKLFLIEFEMPFDGATGTNGDMPAIWMLNAQIPRTLQYGAADCSCWTSGCGELDLFEVLDAGNTRCKSTYHGNISGGDSDYFERPTSGTIQAAITMNGDTATIKVISSSFSFSSTLSASTVSNLASYSSDNTGEVSLFDIE